MGGLFPIIVMVVVFTAIAIAAWWANAMEKRRAEALEAAANELGLAYLPLDPGRLRAIRSKFALFGKGGVQLAKNVIVGDTEEVQIVIFDYQFETGSGNNKQTHRQTVAVIDSDRLRLPSFTMRPENFLDKFGGILGFEDIDFDTHPRFSDAFVLQGAEPEAIRRVFSTEVMDYFSDRPDLYVELVPGSLLLYRRSQRKPEDLRTFLAEAYQVYGLLVDR
ncbi:MAG: hypothetical protein KF851_13615 [Pirellulaceae bacterium]|jgi:hypothetical protein|nr:hypothetical protein [Pirellulaceae bacterium]